ncbi:DUF4175 family protein [Massilia sp. CF038]|uniref:DUF4175 family protein n=1 Tax=Massilia sp. CF038 TaxID=1881045 RepID=UPI000922BF85|nr:DUF4175 family protein [Massilia sp. CF038]SHH69468.1 protein of unknown function [Massilia sp. CF038]
MQNGADIIARLLRRALWRKVPFWAALLLPWVLLASIPGAVLALAWIAWDCVRLRARIAAGWPRWLDGAIPALEDSSALLEDAATPLGRLQQQRLMGRVQSLLSDDMIAQVVAQRTRLHWLALVLSAVLATGLFAWRHVHADQPPVRTVAVAEVPVQPAALMLRVTPPEYTKLARFDTAPRELQVPLHSQIEWCLTKAQTDAPPVELSDGQLLKLDAGCARWRATESVFWRWQGKRYKLRVIPDEAPVVTFALPRDMLSVLPATATNATMTVAVKDDYAVKRAVLHMTLARGSGENIRFSDREVPLPESSDPRTRSWSKQWSLSELGMEPGDELYFFVRASDNAEPPHATVSPTYTLRLPGPVASDDESTALPMLAKPENLRSQRQIIIDTEQLIADLKAKPSLEPATVRSRSEAIASDQAMLRRRYGQFLGEESSLFGDEHEDHGGKEDLVKEYGHKHDQEENATLFDESTKKVLRRALSAMWDAEKSLRAITPKAALPPEYKALEAIKELQQADRIYLHKTAFVPPPIKEEIRMTGDVVGTRSYRRAQGGPGEGVPQDLQVLLQALDGNGALPALWSRTAQDWIRSRIPGDEQRLEAQRAVQDVADGCEKCRPALRAWLRGAINDAPILLQATPQANTPFARAWRKGGKP